MSDRPTPTRRDRRTSETIAIVFCLAFIAFALGDWLLTRITSEPAASTDIEVIDETSVRNITDGGLVVPDNAKNASRLRGAYGSIQVRYDLNEQHPAKMTIQQVAARLQILEWKPLANDWLNPGMPSSHSTGWGQFMDATVKPRRFVRQWTAQWTDSKGNIVGYCFRYSYPVEGKLDLVSLHVDGFWYPAKSVPIMQSASH